MQVQQQQTQTVVFTIPIFEPLPSQYYVRVISDRWLGSEMTFPISFQHLILPEKHPPHTGLSNAILASSKVTVTASSWVHCISKVLLWGDGLQCLWCCFCQFIHYECEYSSCNGQNWITWQLQWELFSTLAHCSWLGLTLGLLISKLMSISAREVTLKYVMLDRLQLVCTYIFLSECCSNCMWIFICDVMCEKLEPVSLMIKKSRLRWFGHVERKDDNDWVKRCITSKLKELDREDVRKRPSGIVLSMT